jgi:hypothetical protein
MSQNQENPIIVSDDEEETPAQLKVHHSGLFHVLQTVGTNQKLRCFIGNCRKVLWGGVARAHVEKDHKPHLAHWDSLKKKSSTTTTSTTGVQSTLSFPPITDEERVQIEERDRMNQLVEGTAKNLFRRIGLFIVMYSLSFRLVGLDMFRYMIIAAINYGASTCHTLAHNCRFLPSPRTLVENTIEGTSREEDEASVKGVNEDGLLR